MNKNLLASIIIAGGIFAFFMLILPQFENIGVSRAALKTRDMILQDRGASVAKVKELDQQYKTRQADIDKIAGFMPSEKRADQIVSSIQQIASQNGLSLTEITTAAPTQTGGSLGYQKLFVSMNLTGTYPAFVNFLKSSEENLRLYDIFEILASLATTPTGALGNMVDFSIKLNAYYID